MHRIACIAAFAAVLIAVPAGATTASPAASVHRQLMDCMSKRMSANRTLSYLDAERTCKEQLKTQRDTLAANNVVKP